MDEITAISSEDEYVRIFGKPDSNTFEYFFSATNFLQYGNALRVVKIVTGNLNADQAVQVFRLKTLIIILTITPTVLPQWEAGQQELQALGVTTSKYPCVQKAPLTKKL